MSADPGRSAWPSDVQVHDRVWEDFAVDLMLDGVGHGADGRARVWRGVASSGETYAVKLSAGRGPAGLVVASRLEDVLLWVLDAADSERLALGERLEALEIVEGLLSPRGLVTLPLGSLRAASY